MPNFVTFDDGLSYIAISEIESFSYDESEKNKGGTVVKFKDGHERHTHWSIEEVAKRLGPTVNLHY